MFSLLSSMGWYWVIVPLVVAFIGVLILLSGIVRVLMGRFAWGASNLVIGAPVAFVGLALSLLALNTQTVARLTQEGAVAEVSIKAKDPAQKIYTVTVNRKDEANSVYTCDIQGDEWEMSARVQKWQPWANILGLDATYRLEQMTNRYIDAVSANGKMITACSLKGEEPAINAYVPQHWLRWVVEKSYTEDRRFGSAAFMPLADGAVYRVVMTQSGLNAEPANDVATKANNSRS